MKYEYKIEDSDIPSVSLRGESKEEKEKLLYENYGVFVPDGLLRVGNLVRVDGVWYDLDRLTKIKRSSTDICYFGGKSKGKSMVMAYHGLTKYLNNISLGNKYYTVYSNFHLNFPHVYINDVNFLNRMTNGIFLGDDLEAWLSSKFGKAYEKQNVLEIMLQLGKRNIDVLWSCKRPLGVIKDLRDTTDYFIECDMVLIDMPRSVDEYLFKSQFLDFCKIVCEVYDYNAEWVKDEELYDLEVYGHLYSTTEEIKRLKH